MRPFKIGIFQGQAVDRLAMIDLRKGGGYTFSFTGRSLPLMLHKSHGPGTKLLPRGLVILHEDRDILVVDKPPDLLTIGTDSDKIRTAYYILTDYIRKGQDKSRKRIFIVHRLDRETSGILVFAKNPEAKLYLQDRWKETEKKYLAVVHGRFEKKSETITSILAENKARVVYSTSDSGKGKLSRTAYKVLKQTRDFALLEVDPLTGRKNQIRVQLADIGHAIVGDKKYGKEGRRRPRLALHAQRISFKHPFSGQRITFETAVPVYFNQLVGDTIGMDRPVRNGTRAKQNLAEERHGAE